MRTEIEIDAAAEAGIIDEFQALALRNFQADRDGLSAASSEKFLLFGGYADLVAAAGLAILLTTGLAIPVSVLGPRGPSGNIASAIACAAAYGFVLWLLLRWTARKDLASRPAFTASLFAAVMGAGFAALFCLFAFMADWRHIFETDLFPWHSLEEVIGLPFGAMGASYACWRFWRLTRYPIAPAAIPMIWAVTVLQAIRLFKPLSADPAPVFAVILAIGLVSLILAIWWDVSDIRRETYRSQVAFWLHACAGILITFSISMLAGIDRMPQVEMTAWSSHPQIMAFIPLILTSALLSLLFDRRSLLLGACLPLLIIKVGPLPIGLPIVGVLLLSFSIAWISLRTAILGALPIPLAAQLPRTSLTHTTRRPTRQRLDYWPRKAQRQGGLHAR